MGFRRWVVRIHTPAGHQLEQEFPTWPEAMATADTVARGRWLSVPLRYVAGMPT